MVNNKCYSIYSLVFSGFFFFSQTLDFCPQNNEDVLPDLLVFCLLGYVFLSFWYRSRLTSFFLIFLSRLIFDDAFGTAHYVAYFNQNTPVVVHHCSVGLFVEISTTWLPKYYLRNKQQFYNKSDNEKCIF